jgi:hypothetical protein
VFGRKEIKSILPLVRFRTTDPRHLDGIPEETRVLIRTLEIKPYLKWNTGENRDGYDMVYNPVGRRPPAWFSPTHMSLKGTILPGLRKLHLRIEFDTGYFIAMFMPEKRMFYAAETARALDDWKKNLEAWNEGVEVVADSNSLQQTLKCFDEVMERSGCRVR